MWRSDEPQSDAWWVSTKEFLPDNGEKVLVIDKCGAVHNQMFTDYGLGGKMLFRPDGLKPVQDVKWWMPIPIDGWNDIKKVKPDEGEVALTMGAYGRIFSGVWKTPCGAREPMFMPYVWDVLFWRPMPLLPKGVPLMAEDWRQSET